MTMNAHWYLINMVRRRAVSDYYTGQVGPGSATRAPVPAHAPIKRQAHAPAQLVGSTFTGSSSRLRRSHIGSRLDRSEGTKRKSAGKMVLIASTWPTTA